MKKKMRSRSEGDDSRAQHSSQPRVFEAHVEGIIDLRALALAKGFGGDGLRLSEQDKRLIDQMRAQIEEHAGAGIVIALPPHRLRFQAKAIEAGFKLDHFPESSRAHEFCYGAEIAIAAAILIDGQHAVEFVS